jgi:hypothetical protein
MIIWIMIYSLAEIYLRSQTVCVGGERNVTSLCSLFHSSRTSPAGRPDH